MSHFRWCAKRTHYHVHFLTIKGVKIIKYRTERYFKKHLVKYPDFTEEGIEAQRAQRSSSPMVLGQTSSFPAVYPPLGKSASYCYQAWVQLLVTQESNTKRRVLGKRKESFTEDAGIPGYKVDLCPKGPTPHSSGFAQGLHREKRKGLLAVEGVAGCVINSWTFFFSWFLIIYFLKLNLKAFAQQRKP